MWSWLRFRSYAEMVTGARCGNSPARLDNWTDWLKQQPQCRSRSGKTRPQGVRIDCAGWTNQLGSTLGSVLVLFPVPGLHGQLRRGSHPCHPEHTKFMDFNNTRYIPMSRRRRIYEGKAKVLYEGPEPGTLIQHFKDDATAFNAKKHQVI